MIEVADFSQVSKADKPAKIGSKDLFVKIAQKKLGASSLARWSP